ncbi:Heat Repeat-Containing Protein 5B [Manis pentadactyla]|nr:Heat Repeat-Containing Protein 5B [Manis pentadactyla]
MPVLMSSSVPGDGSSFGPSRVTEKYHSTGSYLNTHVSWGLPCSRRMEAATITALPTARAIFKGSKV